MKHSYSKQTKTFKLQQALQSGETITASVAAKRFGIKNLSAEVSRVKQNGYVVAKSTRTAANGIQVTEFRLGQPSRALIAAGYAAISAGLV